MITFLVLAGIIVYVALFGYLGGWIADQKGRDPWEGVALGILLAVPGLIIVALLPERR